MMTKTHPSLDHMDIKKTFIVAEVDRTSQDPTHLRVNQFLLEICKNDEENTREIHRTLHASQAQTSLAKSTRID